MTGLCSIMLRRQGTGAVGCVQVQAKWYDRARGIRRARSSDDAKRRKRLCQRLPPPRELLPARYPLRIESRPHRRAEPTASSGSGARRAIWITCTTVSGSISLGALPLWDAGNVNRGDDASDRRIFLSWAVPLISDLKLLEEDSTWRPSITKSG